MNASDAMERRSEVWVAMAELFLDTETRWSIPRTALSAVEAGLSVSEACEVWRYEVYPALAFNLWDIAGEWAGWERDWLIARIERVRRRWFHASPTCRALRKRLSPPPLKDLWLATARHMELLLPIDEPGERQQMADDLVVLARHYVDFCPTDFRDLSDEPFERIRALHPEPFEHAIRPVLNAEELTLARYRMKLALLRRGAA